MNHSDSITGVVFSKGDDYLISIGGSEKSIMIWEIVYKEYG